MRCVILLILIMDVPVLKAQQSLFFPDIYAAVESYATKPGYVPAATQQQAALGRMKQFGLAFTASKPFMLIQQAGMVVVLPVQNGSFGWRGTYFGTSNYQQISASLSYGRNIRNIDLGLQFNYYHRNIPGYYRSAAIGCEAGMMIQLNSSFRTGMHVSNPVAMKWNKPDEKLQGVYAAGFGFEPSSVVLVMASILKTEDEPVGCQAGLRYRIHDKLGVSLGLSTLTETFFLGIQCGLKQLLLNCSLSWHRSLGYTPGFGLQFEKSNP